MRTVLLISPNVTDKMGGEAIKVLQFALYLKKVGRPFRIICHERSAHAVEAAFDPGEYMMVRDNWLQLFLWRSVILRPVLNLHFNHRAARLVRATFRPQDVFLHYMAPVSPVIVRLPPKGFDFVAGPMTGNIFYPPAFKHRVSLKDRIRENLHVSLQKLSKMFFTDKKRAHALLVSGYERTRASLKMAGARDEQLVDVVDAGVSPKIAEQPRISHEGRNTRFFCSGRMVDHKGFDLAIKALARTDGLTLDISGDGEKRVELEVLAVSLGVSDRVNFLGWLPYDDLVSGFKNYRAYVFPSLAEANGIVMQEAMMIGLPVITLRWGGPAALAADDGAVYVDPTDEEGVVAGIAAAMTDLADNPDRAEAMSVASRARAESRFKWDDVAASWMAVYPD